MKKVLLSPLTLTYKRLLSARENLYERNVFKTYTSPAKVISIGNLTMGGTGKTPVTLFLIQHFLKQKIKVAVVSRNYKAEFKGTEKVQLAHPHGASYYGDEAFMLQSNFPQIPIYVGPQKSKTVKMVDENENVDVILVDDGFQHWALKRNIDVVLLDATENEKNYELVPVGRARESFKALNRAQVIVITKSNLATAEKIKWLLGKIPQEKLKNTFLFDSFLGEPQIVFSPSGQVSPSMEDLARTSFVGFCGLAKPDLFFEMLKNKNQFELKDQVIFSDHHTYGSADILNLIQKYPSVKHFVTTEKDYKKVLPLWPSNLFLWMTPLVFSFSNHQKNSGSSNDFFAQLNS